MVRISSAASRSSSAAREARACHPNGSPACSQVTECHGPAQTTNSDGQIRGVVAKVHRPASASCSTTRPLPRTVQRGSEVTDTVKVALRSGWSKQAKTRWATSRERYAET